MHIRKKLWLAAVLSVLSSPMMCGGMVGMAMGERPMPDGRIGQDPWQFPVAMLFGAMSIVYLVLFVWLVVVLVKGGSPKLSTWLVRIAGLSPVGAGIAMFVAGYQRVMAGLFAEAFGACLVGTLLLLVASRLVLTKEQEFIDVDTPSSATPKDGG